MIRIFKSNTKFQTQRKTVQLLKFWLLAAENIRDDLQYVVKTDAMLSPGTTSLEIISIGRGRIPFLGPIFWKSTGP
jgi:hypothetical protein